MKTLIELAEKAILPDPVIRWAIRMLDRKRILMESRGNAVSCIERKKRFLLGMREHPIALQVEKPNEQHYEVPSEFFVHVMGSHMKYSCCFWDEHTETLDDAERAMLEIYGRRAQLEDGMQIMDLGCGWGSFALWAAKRYPASKILALSNSTLQKTYILKQCEIHGLYNLEVVTGDVNRFDTDRRFDRVVCVEMFEHMRNWETLLHHISGWLKPEGKLFVHIFTHRRFAYTFETTDPDDWMGRYFFTAGMMPSDDLMLYHQRDLILEDHWRVCGVHYQKTAEAWLNHMDCHREHILPVLKTVYGKQDALRWFQRWRIFFMACAELWGFKNGSEWLVSHYRFRKRYPLLRQPVGSGNPQRFGFPLDSIGCWR